MTIQHGHGIFCSDYTAPVVRTGKEASLAQQTTEIFAKAAEQDGEVISVKPEGIIVKYADGTEEGYPLGRQFGVASSQSFPFTLVTDMVKGQKFKEGDILTFNTEFFTKDTVARNTVVWKNAVQTTVALVEVPATYEDGDAICQSLADKLTSYVTETIPIRVRFNQAIHELVKVGQKVVADDHLCIIEDSVTAGSSLFDDEESLRTLRLLQAQTPRAGVDGVVEKIVVYYNGDKDDMSESIRKITDASDKQIVKERTAAGKTAVNGMIPLGESYRVNGDPLLNEELVIFVYITTKKSAGVGDKLVVANQLKTIISQVLPKDIETESGVKVSMQFGIKSAGNRIVNSVYDIGIDARLCTKATQRAINAYMSPIKK